MHTDTHSFITIFIYIYIYTVDILGFIFRRVHNKFHLRLNYVK